MATNGVLRSRINKWSKAATAIVNNYSKLGNYAQHFDSIITNLEKYDSPVNVEEDIKKLEEYLNGSVQSDYSTAVRDFCTNSKTCLTKNYSDFRNELKNRNFWGELKKLGYKGGQDKNEKARLEKERLEREKLEKERLEKERLEKELQEQYKKIQQEQLRKIDWKTEGEEFEKVQKEIKKTSIPKQDYYQYPKQSLWQRFDDFITDIGDWFAENINNAPDIVALILAGIYVIGALATIIYTWINDGFGWAILAFVISVALGYVGLIAIGIVNLICKFIMGALRLYFYSGASFLVLNILIFSCVGFIIADKNYSPNVKAKTEISAPATIEYICTANEFINIRVSPNTKANVLGRVKRGESVQVYEIKNGFAKVKWGSGYGYANAKYIKKKY